MKITKIISIFIIITLFYVGTNYIINQPPSSMAYEIRMSAYWVNFGISLPLKLINLIIPKEYTSESPMLMFSSFFMDFINFTMVFQKERRFFIVSIRFRVCKI